MVSIDIRFAEIDNASVQAIRAMIAWSRLELYRAQLAPELEAQLAAIAGGGEPDARLLARGLEATFAGLREMDWYDGGIQEKYGNVAGSIEVMTVRPQRLIRECEQAASQLATAEANGQFWATAHAANYCFDRDAVVAQVARAARERVEAQWRALQDRPSQTCRFGRSG